jgi:hypothetical protein
MNLENDEEHIRFRDIAQVIINKVNTNCFHFQVLNYVIVSQLSVNLPEFAQLVRLMNFQNNLRKKLQIRRTISIRSLA